VYQTEEIAMLKKLVLAAAVVVSLGAQAQTPETPRNGGTIRFTAPYGASFGGMDIHATNLAQDEIWARALHRALYKWDSNLNKPVLELAKSVSVSADGLVYTYKLRDDAFFHHGRKMTADDVIWSFNRIVEPGKSYPGARFVRAIKGAVEVEKGEAKTISGLRKIDDFTIEMTLTQRIDPAYSFNLAVTAIYPADEAVKESFARKPIGLGPYKFVEYVPGSRIVLERFDKFYAKGKPHADKLVIYIMGDAAARDVAFRNKEVDVSVLGPAQYVAYRADPNLSKGILEVTENYTRYMGMNSSFKPFTDKRVRQAINHAIDSDLIIKKMVYDKAYRASGWLPTTSSAFDKNLKPYTYDTVLAKKLLTEAGYPNGFEFELTASNNESWGSPIAEAFIPMLAKVGIKAKIVPVDGTVLGERVRKGDYQAYLWSNGSGPDALAALKCFHSATPRSACNYTEFKNAAIDKVLDEADRMGPTNAKRDDVLKQANAMIYEEAPFWFFNYNKAVLAHQPWIKGLQRNANEMAWQNYEDIWVDASSPAAK
jgi:peptide/nickel transport system substrate-binding protein